MHKDIAMKWVEALRSGNYKQGHHRLRTRTSGGYQYCCLGVLCEVIGYQSILDREVLSGKARDLVGMKSCIGYFPSLDISLTVQNDAKCDSFNEIADIIEAHYEEL